MLLLSEGQAAEVWKPVLDTGEYWAEKYVN
jgi:hypothetical protein